MQVLFIDEVGQISSELMAILNVILRTIRKSTTYLVELLIISTLDHIQLPPVNGNH